MQEDRLMRMRNGITVFGLTALSAASFFAGVALQPTSNASSATTNGVAALPLSSDPNIFTRLATDVMPSVVNISTLSRPRKEVPQFFEEFFAPGMRIPGGGEREAPRPASLGTGFVIDGSGIILTNHHVVNGADEIKIYFTEEPDEKPIDGKVIGRDPDLDIALIRVKTDRKLIPLALGDSDRLQVGEYVAAVGNPFGQGHSFTHGIISAKGRISPNVPLATYLQTDAPINPGNSGGPLINLKGEVIGINNAIDARAQNIGFAIPINAVKKILPELQSKGVIARGYIGVTVSELRPEIAEKINVAKDLSAPLVMQVAPGGPAFRAGIRPYDVITEINGKPVRTASELTDRVTSFAEGSVIEVKVAREDRDFKTKVKLGRRPSVDQS